MAPWTPDSIPGRTRPRPRSRSPGRRCTWRGGSSGSPVSGVPPPGLAKRARARPPGSTRRRTSPAVVEIGVSGGTVYVAGGFIELGGQRLLRLGAVDAATGEATGFGPEPDDSVSALEVSGSTVYASGGFSRIGGQDRVGVAALNAL